MIPLIIILVLTIQVLVWFVAILGVGFGDQPKRKELIILLIPFGYVYTCTLFIKNAVSKTLTILLTKRKE